MQENNGPIGVEEFLNIIALTLKANEKIREVSDVFDTDADIELELIKRK